MKTIPIKREQPTVSVDKSLLAPPLAYNRRTAKIAAQYARVADGAKGAPISVQVALTDRCFNRCVMCDHPSRQPRTITPEDWLNFLRRVPAIESVCYSGGDPMAYHAFNDVMDYHIDKHIPFGATITGYVPKYIDIARLAKAAWIRVSLDAVTPSVYEVVRGHTPIEKVLRSIDAMLDAHVNVCLGITVHPQNESDLPYVLAYAKAKGITDIDVRPVYPDSSVESVDGLERYVQPFNRCHAALYQLYIDADGAVYPCCITAGDTRGVAQGYSLGNISDDWAVVWKAVTEYSRLSIDDLPEICRTCCVQRLSEINYVCDRIDEMPARGSFF